MKKILFLSLCGMFFVSMAYAKHDACMMQGGFYDEEAATMTVQDILQQPENTFVNVKGYITKRIGKDTYNFTDGKDSMTIEVDDKHWCNRMISPKDMVVLYGEVDKDDGMTYIDVKSLYQIKK